MGSRPARLPAGPWKDLLGHALTLVDGIAARGTTDPFWTFGGGTVLMLRYQHRRSKDIDIFVPDPQYLGHVSPRLSDLAESITTDYVEGAGYVKLIRPEGEIDFVASPNLTDEPFETWTLMRRKVRVETAAEIVAKKLWHRGDRASARDLFDLSLVIERNPEPLRRAAKFLVRHRTAFIRQLEERETVLRAQFDAIDVLNYRPAYDDASARAKAFLESLPAAP
jgi:predicted nucleotidyltransferase component of viral defense system